MTHDQSVAIVGMSCRFPGAADMHAFWRSARDGRSHFRDVPADRWDHAAFYSPNPRHSESTYARKIAYLDDVRSFAPEWYGMSGRRSRPMDPQQRLVLNEARLALDDAGYGGRRLPRSTGVYVGASTVEYKDVVLSRLRAHQFLGGEFGQAPANAGALAGTFVENIVPIQSYTMVGLLLNMIACNVSEAFDLGGPSLVLDAACSSSLLAVHEAVLHLRAGVCDAALAAGVYTICSPDNLVGFSRIGAVSKSDVCRPFDERADGFVLGEGVGAVILKRLDDAVRDRDRIWAVIRGVGLNNDGRGDGPMTPRLSGQCEALARACRDADVPPDTVGYIEAHGTATAVGDMTEIGALKEHARSHRQGPVHCAVASVKGNIGHTLAASGIAGLIKTVLAINHRTIPPQAGLEHVRRTLDLNGSGFYVPAAALSFDAVHGLPRRAGISSFGFGGTNVHAIIEEAPEPERRPVSISVPAQPRPELFVVSAPTPALLVDYLAALASAAADSSAPVRDLAYTLTVTRRREASRVAFIASSAADLRGQLHAAAAAVRGEPSGGAIHVAEAQRDTGHDATLVVPTDEGALHRLCEDLAGRFSAFRSRAARAASGPAALAELLAALGLGRRSAVAGWGDTFGPEGTTTEPTRFVTLSFQEGEGARDFLDALGELMIMGVPLQLGELFEDARLVSLPSPALRTRPFWAVTSHRTSEPGEHREAASSGGNGNGSSASAAHAGGSSQIDRRIRALEAQVAVLQSQAPGDARVPAAAARPTASLAASDDAPRVATPAAPTREAAIRAGVMDLITQISATPGDSLSPDQRLGVDLGFDSLLGVDLYVRLTETFPEAKGLPESLIGGETTVEALVQAVIGAVAAGDGHVPRETTQEIRRCAVVHEDRPLPLAPARLDWPFEGRVRLVADSRGVAAALAGRIGASSRDVTTVGAADDIAAGDGEAVIDLSGIDQPNGGAEAPAACREPVLAALRRARGLIGPGSRPAALVLVHAGDRNTGLAGVAKALAREWPGTLVKSVEVRVDAAADQIAETIFDELIATDRRVEVTYASGRRQVLVPRPSPVERRPLADGVVAAIAGGGRGLGATLAIELARTHHARLLLLGRAAEAAATVQAVRAHGGDAMYVSADVRDPAEVAAAFEACRARFGPIEIVVHAAGVLDDAVVGSKDAAREAAVFDTKVAGAWALWRAAQPDPLRTFLMYGSWAGRFGNAQQTDYSAANHVLGRLAGTFAGTRPGTRVVTLDLPPWENSGMVRALPPSARDALRARVPFLHDEDGLAFVLAELGAGAPSGEVILGSALDDEERVDRAVVRVSVSESPWLDEHRVDGRMLMPFVAMLQQCAAAAFRVGVTLPFTLAGATLTDTVVIAEEVATRLAVTARGPRTRIRVDLERVGPGSPAPVLRLDAMPVAGPLPLLVAPPGDHPPSLPLGDFYGTWTFHGPALRALTEVLASGPGHAEAIVRCSEVADPDGSAIDFLAVDGMLQLCAYWASTSLGRIGLPSGAGEIRVLRNPEPRETLRVIGLVTGSSGDTIESDLDLLDTAGCPVVQMRGLRCRLAQQPSVVPGPAAPLPPDPSAWRIEEFPEVKVLHERLEMARAAGIENPYFSVHERVTNETSLIGGREYVNFASYNYLGLSGDPDVTGAAIDALRRYGSSVSASRLAPGEKPLPLALERGLADFLGCEDAIVMVGGHATNVSVIGHMLGAQDLVIHDSLAHDSILAGIRLSGAKRRAFPHNDVEGLEWLLTNLRQTARRVLVAVEGVYSMDGDIAPLDRIIELKRRHRALLLVDEAHSLGVLGQTGRGIGELFGVDRRDVDFWMGTLSKSLASCGGYIAGSHALVRYLKYTNPGFVYSVGISPPNAAAALAALERLRDQPSLVTTLQERSRAFLEASRRHGLDTGLSGGTAVVPCIIGNSNDCLRLSRALAGRAINVQPILYPAVEERGARLRFFVTARHTEHQIHATVAACAEELARIDPRYRPADSTGVLLHGPLGA